MKLVLKKNNIFFIIVLLLTSFYILDTSIYKYLAYNLYSIEKLQLWRLFTANFLHTNFYHFILNTFAFTFIFFLFKNNFSFKFYIFLFIFLCFTISTCIYFFSKDIINYVGLSGVLHGLLIYGLYLEKKSKVNYLMIFIIWFKVIYEQIFGASKQIEELIKAQVAIDAHFYGVVLATFIYFISIGYIKSKNNNYKNLS